MYVRLFGPSDEEGIVLPTRPDLLWVKVEIGRNHQDGWFSLRGAIVRTRTKTGWHKRARHAYGRELAPTAEERALLLAAAMPRYAELCRIFAQQARQHAERYEEDAEVAERWAKEGSDEASA